MLRTAARARSLSLSLAIALVPVISQATTTFTFEGTSAAGVNVRFTADLTISGNLLTLVLTNDSLNHTSGPSYSKNPADVIGSFYFDIFDGSSRPILNYTGGTGDVCILIDAAPDDCTATTDNTVAGSTESDLRASVAGDDGWQFESGLNLVVGSTTLTFGVGTVGNNSLNPNGFMGNVVDGLDFSIYAGHTGTAADTGTNGLANMMDPHYVHNTATFTFTGVSGFTEANIVNGALFGMGTQPDSTGFVPEPSTALLLGLGLVGLAARRRR